MQNKPSNFSDFFDRYHRARTQMYVLPAIFGIAIAFGAVSMAHTGDMRGLMASVAQVAQPQYDADLVMRYTDSGVEIIMGRAASAVDTIELRLLTDPSDKVVFTPSSGTVVSEGEGMTQFIRSFAHADVPVGTVIATFPSITRDMPVALTDAEFTSEGKRYSLTSKGE
jgi:hypothetical protein